MREPVDLPVAAGPPPGAGRPRFPWRDPGLAVVALLPALALFVAGVVGTVGGRADAARIVGSGPPVEGKVVRHVADDTEVELEVVVGGRSITTRAGAYYVEDYPVGARYQVHVDPTDTSRGRLVVEPYDAVEPLVWTGLPLAVAVVGAGARLTTWRRIRRVADTGPWSSAVARSDGSTCQLSPPTRPDDPFCAVETEDVRSWEGPVPVVVAGDGMPGSPVALWRLDGAPITTTRPAGAPPRYEGLPGQHLRIASDAVRWATGVALLLLAMLVALGVSEAVLPSTDEATADAVFGAVFLAGSVPAITRAWSMKLVVGPTGVAVHNLWRTHRVPWSDVAAFVEASGPKGELYIGVERADGRVVRASAAPLPEGVLDGSSSVARRRIRLLRAAARVHGVPVRVGGFGEPAHPPLPGVDEPG